MLTFPYETSNFLSKGTSFVDSIRRSVMYCPKCGTQHDDNAYKCTKCGIILHPVPAGKKNNTTIIVLVIAGIALVFFAVVGILAAIAIPAYLDYTVKSKITEVTAGMDALAQAASEYHASLGYFPAQNYSFNDLASLSQIYGTFSCPARTGDNAITYRFTFNNTISSSINGCTLDMEITYSPSTGYAKQWLATSTLPKKYTPRQ
jgi:Tfp pilus assembly protein PilE